MALLLPHKAEEVLIAGYHYPPVRLGPSQVIGVSGAAASEFMDRPGFDSTAPEAAGDGAIHMLVEHEPDRGHPVKREAMPG